MISATGWCSTPPATTHSDPSGKTTGEYALIGYATSPVLNGLAADTELLVSELVTNAVKATAGKQQAAIRLQLSSDSSSVLIEVWDADPQPPAPKDLTEDGRPDLQEEGGRGLFLVAALSSRWDWYRTREPPGKVVWCELQVPAQQALLRRLRDCLRAL